MDPISSDEEELAIPVSSVPILIVPPSPLTTGAPAVDATQPGLAPEVTTPIILAHIPTSQPTEDMSLGTGPLANSQLTTTKWSSLITKAQSGEVPTGAAPLMADTASAPSGQPSASPLAKTFTADVTIFSLKPEPGALPDCLIQMALN